MNILLKVIFTVALAVLAFLVIDAADPCDKYSRFKRAFNLSDSHLSEEDKAAMKEYIAANCDQIQEHRLAFSMGLVTYELKPMPYMNKNLTEVRDSKCGLVLPKSLRSLPAKGKKKKKKPKKQYPPAPKARNWCYLHSPIRDQKACGGCWAFGTAAVIEAAITRVRGMRMNISEQHLIDCDVTNSGCSGGWPTVAMKYVQLTGIDARKDYKYKNKKTKCHMGDYKTALNKKAIVKVHEENLHGNETRLAEIINAVGPVAGGIFVTIELMAYGGGVYLNDKCKRDINHAIVICGYGVDPVAGPYWIVRNSWGKRWGERGYVRIARGRNMCGIGSYAMWPEL